MGFFQGAYDFEISGGAFYDVRGDQINRTNDNSLKIGGTGNKTDISPNMSRQDNRTYNHEERQYTAVHGPADSQPSTYPGYGQASPMAGMSSQTQHPSGQQGADPQLYAKWVEWCEFKRWQEWQQFQLYQQQQQQQQQQYHHAQQPAPPTPPPEPTGPHHQYSQAPSPTAAHQSHPSAQNTSTSAHQYLTEEEDPEVQNLQNQFQHHHIGEQPEYAYAGGQHQGGVHMYNSSTTYL
ncbi:hypothetical protein D9756_002885 [Leucocoprinus leucothites]|uniref:Uncharacterized protein n=1 Tax=Leucocoprinus leucothites TaxID=201217 RepID=A0A8H5G6G5_9AGAR|nr:hypothetical protein D9756_002885 [Leucoagaricus leucothites]